MKQQTGIVFLLWLLFSAPAMAQTDVVHAVIGGVQLTVKAPAGFHEISLLSPETHSIMETFTPPTNRLLGVFVSQADMDALVQGNGPVMDRYMMLQTNRQLEGMTITGDNFRELSGQVREQQYTLLDKHQSEIEKLVDNAAENLSREYDIEATVEVGRQVPLGVFIDQPGSIGIGFLGKYRTEVNGEPIESVVASGVSYVLHENKLLYMYVYSNYESEADIEWVKAKTAEWVNNL